ncbi:MAG: hypothetical protein JKX98_02355 [Alcanivoracaceae bacterium]|nr:hypothetical protein [Alcanivoracaceae bacterium]
MKLSIMLSALLFTFNASGYNYGDIKKIEVESKKLVNNNNKANKLNDRIEIAPAPVYQTTVNITENGELIHRCDKTHLSHLNIQRD